MNSIVLHVVGWDVVAQYKKRTGMSDSHKFKDSKSDLRNKCLDHQFSIVFTKNLIKLHESLNNNLK